MGEASKVVHLSHDTRDGEGLVEKAQERTYVMLENTLDAMKTSQVEVPVYLVGGWRFKGVETLTSIDGSVGVGASAVVATKEHNKGSRSRAPCGL